MQSAEEIVSYLRAHPKLAATEDYELCVQHANGRYWKFLGNQETSRGTDETMWVGLRVLQRRQPGYSSGFAASREALDEIVSRSVFASTIADPDPWFRFPVIRQSGSLAFSIRDPKSPELLEEWQNQNVESTWYQWKSTGHLLRRLEKKEVTFPQYFEKCFIRQVPGLITTERVTENLSPPVWMHGRVMSQLLSLIGDWFCADRVRSGLSPLADKMKQRVFSSRISLTDNGDWKQGNQVPMDLEGVGTQTVSLVHEGEVAGFLHSSRTAAMENRPSTGHYLRMPDEEMGRIRPLSLCLLPDENAIDLLAEMGEGYTLEFLEEMVPVGNHAVSFRGMGRRVHAGQPGAWVMLRSANCDLLDLLNRVEGVGKELSLYGNFGSPSILFNKMPLSITR